MIVLTCVSVPQPGHEAECQALAKELTTSSQDHEGLIGYFWTLDETTQELHVVEVHQDEASVFNHIALTDVSALAALSSFKDIKVFGDAPSPKLLATLSGFGEYAVYPLL
jgi:quinol monooxygenase YgiN